MLYVIYGTDTKKARTKAGNLIEALQKKRPDASLFRMNTESWNAGLLGEAISTTSLFAPKNILVLDSLFQNEESETYILEHLADLQKTEHVCVVIEGKLTKENIKKVSSKAEKVEEHNLPESSGFSKKEAPRSFALASALIQKDFKKSWSIFQELKDADMPAEEIHGVLWWQYKALFLTLNTKSAKEADLNPYVYSNCKAVEQKWSKEEVSARLDLLVDMYHKAHRGTTDFMADLETLCLG